MAERYSPEWIAAHQLKVHGGKKSAGKKKAQPAGRDPETGPVAKGNLDCGPSGMNKTEQRYVNDKLWPGHIMGDIAWYSFERVTRNLTIENEKCEYTPDFEVMTKSGAIEYHEIKGEYIEEDARVKFLTAMAQYPMFGWFMWQWKKGEWHLVRHNDRKGKSANFCVVM